LFYKLNNNYHGVERKGKSGKSGKAKMDIKVLVAPDGGICFSVGGAHPWADMNDDSMVLESMVGTALMLSGHANEPWELVLFSEGTLNSDYDWMEALDYLEKCDEGVTVQTFAPCENFESKVPGLVIDLSSYLRTCHRDRWHDKKIPSKGKLDVKVLITPDGGIGFSIGGECPWFGKEDGMAMESMVNTAQAISYIMDEPWELALFGRGVLDADFEWLNALDYLSKCDEGVFSQTIAPGKLPEGGRCLADYMHMCRHGFYRQPIDESVMPGPGM
jgi:hypothetical protein